MKSQRWTFREREREKRGRNTNYYKYWHGKGDKGGYLRRGEKWNIKREDVETFFSSSRKEGMGVNGKKG